MKTDTFAQHITNIRQKLTQAPNEPEELRIFLFGKKQGLFSEAASLLRELSPEEKPAAGQKLQELREEMETLLTEAENTPSKTEWLDPTLPAADRPVGRLHPLSQAINEITDIFEKSALRACVILRSSGTTTLLRR
ncbi:hypothetical protein LRY60_01400 [Candidatus Woesebacteria bacterium]|nr:hypothetical protein [Candidatus Woesebacteria bacterium]